MAAALFDYFRFPGSKAEKQSLLDAGAAANAGANAGAAGGVNAGASAVKIPTRSVSVYEEKRDPYIQALYKRALSFWEHDEKSPKIGPRGLPEHPTANEALFFFRILFFPSMNLKEIYDKFERLGMLDPDSLVSNGNNSKFKKQLTILLSPTIEGVGDVPLYTYDQVQKILERYENQSISHMFEEIERFVSSLRFYVLYGKQYLLWNDFKLDFHCPPNPEIGLESRPDCFYIAFQGYSPDEERTVFIKPGTVGLFYPAVHHVKLSDETFENEMMLALYPYVDREQTPEDLLARIDAARRKALLGRFGLAGGRRRVSRRKRVQRKRRSRHSRRSRP